MLGEKPATSRSLAGRKEVVGEVGGGGRAGQGVTGGDYITLGDRWRRPEENHFSLSSKCC